ncbi:hypothetical protein ACFL2T_07915 [Elusimicrobiota bacterium]
MRKVSIFVLALSTGLASSSLANDAPVVDGAPLSQASRAHMLGLKKRGLFGDCGPFGVMCPRMLIPEVPARMTQADVPPIKGFRDLGTAGTTGDVDGPLSRGNGDYKVLENASHILSAHIKTGYMDIDFTLKRDTNTAVNTATVTGRIWKDERWVDVDGTNVVSLDYDPKRDEGRITWDDEGRSKSEGFWRGENDDRRMTIEFGGGYNHDFKQDGRKSGK